MTNNIRNGLIITLILALCLCTIGWADETSDASSTDSQRTVTVTDMSGDTVTITGEVDRIVNLWPAGTSSFFVIGAGDKIIGMASPGANQNVWAQYFYPGCMDIPGMGGTTPTIEEIINLDPDLVIIHPTTAAAGYAQQIRDVGIPAINIYFKDYETMSEAYVILGEVLGGEYQEKLNDWNMVTNDKIKNVRGLTSDLTDDERPVVFYIAGQSESLTTTMAENSIFSDWVESAGGIYGTRLVPSAAGAVDNVEVTAEAIFDLDPDVFVIGGIWQHVLKNTVETTDGWKELKPVINDRVYTNPYANFNWDRFGLESQLQISYALMCIQPEIAAENGITRESMINEIIEFYEKYTNVTMTQQEAEYMLDGLGPDGKAEHPVE